ALVTRDHRSHRIRCVTHFIGAVDSRALADPINQPRLPDRVGFDASNAAANPRIQLHTKKKQLLQPGAIGCALASASLERRLYHGIADDPPWRNLGRANSRRHISRAVANSKCEPALHYAGIFWGAANPHSTRTRRE